MRSAAKAKAAEAKSTSEAPSVEDVEKKMQELQTTERAKGAAVLSPEQKAEIAKFRGRVLEIRRELREVQLNLRRDIDDLDSRLKIINIAAMPAAVAVVALCLSLSRSTAMADPSRPWGFEPTRTHDALFSARRPEAAAPLTPRTDDSWSMCKTLKAPSTNLILPAG